MQTTIVLVSFKSKIIYDCIKDIKKKYKIIVVENSNDMNFKQQIERSHRNIRCILTGSNLGFARATNIALRQVKTNYSLVINPDVTISINQIKQIENSAKKIKNFSILTPNSNGLFETIKNNSDKLSNIERSDLNSLHNNIFLKNFFEVNFVPGYCMFFRMKDIKRINFFDENFFLYFEDTDLCKRLKKKGKKFYVLSNIKIHHAFGTTPQKKYRNRLTLIRNWHLYWSSFYYHRKHYGFLKSFTVHLSKLIRFSIMKNIYFLLNKKKLYYLLNARSKGLMCQILDKSAFSGPKIN